MITTRGLTKRYGAITALDDLTVDVAAGVVGLVGANGAGKSTLIKLLLGLLPPTSGTVQVLGLDAVREGEEVRRRVGYMPEHDCLPADVSATEFVVHMARISGLPPDAARERTADVLRHVGLYEERYRLIGGYSTGMRQRVKLAQALVHDPELLILDEPLTGMDPLMRRRTIRIIREWARDGRSVLVSSHILHEVEAMTSNVLLINNGRILAEGDVHDIRALIDHHPHTVHIRAERPRELARECLSYGYVRSLRFEGDALVVETDAPDTFYTQLTHLAAAETFGRVEEVTSPDDNLAAVCGYLVK